MNEDCPSIEIEPSHHNVIIFVLMSESSKSNYRKKIVILESGKDLIFLIDSRYIA